MTNTQEHFVDAFCIHSFFYCFLVNQTISSYS